MEENQSFKSGFVSLAGRPNVGKSTLINHIMQQKIAAASSRPQTTQRRQLGILTLEDAQIIFMDTPGIHKPVHKLGDFMNQTAFQTLSDADVIVWLVDASEAPHHEDRLAAERIAAVQPLPPVILALNKIDLISAEQLKERERDFLGTAARGHALRHQRGRRPGRRRPAGRDHLPPARRPALLRTRTDHRPV